MSLQVSLKKRQGFSSTSFITDFSQDQLASASTTRTTSSRSTARRTSRCARCARRAARTTRATARPTASSRSSWCATSGWSRRRPLPRRRGCDVQVLPLGWEGEKKVYKGAVGFIYFSRILFSSPSFPDPLDPCSPLGHGLLP